MEREREKERTGGRAERARHLRNVFFAILHTTLISFFHWDVNRFLSQQIELRIVKNYFPFHFVK
jgi:hypothetical protein